MVNNHQMKAFQRGYDGALKMAASKGLGSRSMVPSAQNSILRHVQFETARAARDPKNPKSAWGSRLSEPSSRDALELHLSNVPETIPNETLQRLQRGLPVSPAAAQANHAHHMDIARLVDSWRAS